jgi:hypothetical protein
MMHLPTINGASMTITVGGLPEVCTSTALTAYEILEDIAEQAEAAHGGAWAVSWSESGTGWVWTMNATPPFSWSTSDHVALGLSSSSGFAVAGLSSDAAVSGTWRPQLGGIRRDFAAYSTDEGDMGPAAAYTPRRILRPIAEAVATATEAAELTGYLLANPSHARPVMAYSTNGGGWLPFNLGEVQRTRAGQLYTYNFDLLGRA